eukprot:CAMPEP_0198155876 /NCGR_PEP_ID=MMETSP1443-20131203/69365_1 /TAXON_ID=186043 /ORGANISM="Entomoneis sp., Strain CCMP2396" /LENGTH=218 /DNA_ID=CAMNT_0043822643 /DNA_START=54 /DNA_END=710 /DNA_ORIENTATION=+
MGRGSLVFKGDGKPKKKKNKVKYNSSSAASAAEASFASAVDEQAKAARPNSDTTSQSVANTATTPPLPPKIQKGTGKLTASGTVVTGHEGTKFLKELQVGNAVLLGNSGDEMRVVTMCLSNVSVNVSSAFAQSYTTPVSFQYIPKPKKASAATAGGDQQEQQTNDVSGTYASNQELVYREKTQNGSYRIVKKQLDDGKQVTRGDLLEMRSKRKSDKYC